MDISDVAVRHVVAISPVHIQHSFAVEISSSTLSIARELRICIIAVVVGWTTASVVRSVLVNRSSNKPA